MAAANHRPAIKPDEIELPSKPRRGRFAWCGRYISSEDSFIYPYRIGSSLEQVTKHKRKVDSELTLTFAIADAGETCFSCAGVQNLPVCGKMCSCCARCCKCCNCRQFFNMTTFIFILILIGTGTGLIVYGVISDELCSCLRQLFISVGAIMYICVVLYFSSLIFDLKQLRNHVQFMLYPWIFVSLCLIIGLTYALIKELVSIQYFVTMIIPLLGIGGYVLGELFLSIERRRLRPLLAHQNRLLRAPIQFDENETDDDEGWTSRTISLHGLHQSEGKKSARSAPKTATLTFSASSDQAGPAFPRRQAAGQGGGGGDAMQKDKMRLLNYHKGKLSVWQARRIRIRHHDSSCQTTQVLLDPGVAESTKVEPPPLAYIPPLELHPVSSIESLEESPDKSSSRLLSHNAWYESENLRTSPPIPKCHDSIVNADHVTPSPSSASYPSASSVHVHMPSNRRRLTPN